MYATGPQRPFGGLWLDWGPAWNVDRVHKVKAHDGTADRHKQGNSIVDDLAKNTAWDHMGPVLVADSYKKAVEERVQFYRQIAKRVAAWPQPLRVQMNKSEEPKAARAQLQIVHQITITKRGWRHEGCGL